MCPVTLISVNRLRTKSSIYIQKREQRFWRSKGLVLYFMALSYSADLHVCSELQVEMQLQWQWFGIQPSWD